MGSGKKSGSSGKKVASVVKKISAKKTAAGSKKPVPKAVLAKKGAAPKSKGNVGKALKK